MAPLAEIYNDPPPIWRSLWHMLNATATAYPERPAVVAMHQPSDHLAVLKAPPNHASSPSNTDQQQEWLAWTYSDVKYAALRLAAGLLAAGVKRGSGCIVATLIPNGIEHELVIWITAALQIKLAPLDPGMVAKGREEQLREYLSRLRPEVIIVGDAIAAEAIDKSPTLHESYCKVRVSVADTMRQGWTSFVELAATATELDVGAASKQDLTFEDGGERTALILFTSGTSTGRPKGCPQSVKNALSPAANIIGVVDYPNNVLQTTVNFRVISWNIGLTTFSRGGCMILPAATFSTTAVFDAIEKCNVQYLIAIPAQVQLYAQDPTIRHRDLTSLTRVSIGGDTVSTDILARARKTFPHAIVATGHGMTEGAGILGWTPNPARVWDCDLPEYHGIVATGIPLSGALVRVCDDAGTVLPRGEIGDLHFGGPLMIRRYLDDDQSETFYTDSHGSWCKTGDRAFMDTNDTIFIVGRSKDIVKKTGISISPAVIEAVLNAVDGVYAAVTAVSHPSFGEVPVAVVSDECCQNLKQLVLEKLGPEYALDDVVTLRELGMTGFPINATGKIMKITLRKAIEERRE